MKSHFEKIGSFGALIAAAACPVCFPKLALVGAFFGLGALGAYEAQLFIVAQALVVLAVAGHALAFTRHRRTGLLVLAALSAAAIFVGLYAWVSEALTYVGFAGLVAASVPGVWKHFRVKASREAA